MNVSFPNDHENPENSQLLLAITGTPEAIINRLEEILAECKGFYKKPIQGTSSQFHCTSSIIRPIWDKKLG